MNNKERLVMEELVSRYKLASANKTPLFLKKLEKIHIEAGDIHNSNFKDKKIKALWEEIEKMRIKLKIFSCPRCNSYLDVTLLEVSENIKYFDCCICGFKWSEPTEKWITNKEK
jgi:hypothetical protein